MQKAEGACVRSRASEEETQSRKKEGIRKARAEVNKDSTDQNKGT